MTSQRDPSGPVWTPNTGAGVAVNGHDNVAASRCITRHHLDKHERNNESIGSGPEVNAAHGLRQMIGLLETQGGKSEQIELGFQASSLQRL